MAERKRSYKREYRRRKARGKRLGLSLSAARGHARAGERPRPAGISTNPHGPEASGLKMMKRGASSEGRCSRQWNQPRAFTALSLREHSSYPKKSRVADPRPSALPSAHLLPRPDCRGLAIRCGGDESRRISQRRGPVPAVWGCISPEAVRRRRRSRHRWQVPSFRDPRERSLSARHRRRAIGARNLQDPRMRGSDGGV